MFTYHHEATLIEIKYIKTEKIGRCLNRNYYRIISHLNRLSRERIIALKKSDFIFSGQTFEILSQCDGKEKPAGFIFKQCIEVDDDGKLINADPVDPETNQPFNQAKFPYYAYDCIDEIDSSD